MTNDAKQLLRLHLKIDRILRYWVNMQAAIALGLRRVKPQ